MEQPSPAETTGIAGSPGSDPGADGQSTPGDGGKFARLWLFAPWLVFAVSLVTKLAVIVPYALAPAGLDELTFMALAETLRGGERYPALQYPPLYPLSLVPATLFADSYRAAVVLGCVYSSAMILPVWLIARELLGVKRAAAVALIAALIPFQYAMPRVVMSEILFYPLLMMAVYLAVSDRWKEFALRDSLFGVLMAALVLTRYLAVVFLPALALAWYMREWERSGSWRLDRGAWTRAGLVAASTGAVLLLWGLFAGMSGFTWSEVFQVERVSRLSGVTRLPDRVMTSGRFARFALAYLSSWALWLAPVLGIIFVAVLDLRNRSLDVRARLTAILLVSAAPLLYVVTRWAWRAHYNWPRVLRIMDRYCIYLVVLGVLVAFASVAFAHSRSTLRTPVAYWFLTVLLPVAILIPAWWLIFKWGFLPRLDIQDPGFASADTYHVLAMGGWFWVVVGVVLLAVAWTARHARTYSFHVLAIGLAIFFAVGLPTYVANSMSVPVAQTHSRYMADAIERARLGAADSVMVWVTSGATTASTDARLARHMRVRLRWMLRESSTRVVIQLKRPRPESIGIILMSADEPGASDAEVLSSYELDGERFVIVRR